MVSSCPLDPTLVLAKKEETHAATMPQPHCVDIVIETVYYILYIHNSIEYYSILGCMVTFNTLAFYGQVVN